ncbi:MAG: biotin/lipoyl-binding protein [Acidobacteria bacterium]|nr:biotin/lipoyl-binding protein [Acidobacteriota bacterium]
MEIQLKIEDQILSLEVTRDGNRYRIRVRDREYDVDCVCPEPGVFSLIVDGKVYEALVSRSDLVHTVNLGNHLFSLELSDPRATPLRQRALALGEGPTAIQAQMPGKVVRILVGEGQEVEPEQGLLVLEAMKMQNEIRSPKKGRVAKIAAHAGATVKSGELLLIIE